MSKSLPQRLLIIFLLCCTLGTAIGLAVFWPRTAPEVSPSFSQTFSLGQKLVDATVVAVTEGSCTSDQVGQRFSTSPRHIPGQDANCTWVIAELADGDRTLILNTGTPGEPDLEVGQHILLNEQLAFVDFKRDTPLLLWALLTIAAVSALALWRGVRAIIGLVMAMAVVAVFTLPALANGTNPAAVALLSGSVILLLAVFFVHGMNWKSASALAGTLTALCVAAALAQLSLQHTHVRGLGQEDNLQVLLYLPQVSIQGLMLCGFIIGALGVLNDVTIAQASTVQELSSLDPKARPLRLFFGAMKVGQDHIASMMYTLVLTYTGASLPLLLLLSLSERSLSQTLTSDVMATELLRSAIGILALTLAVPITTLIAAWTTPREEHKAPRHARHRARP
ncbi:YibE/F family protein [Corynebacterium pelargi]|uniref:YibE/F-like protein n=1 Tax=Corynebacterium pelargi TaxID=1471400 RepID=A0A410W6F6_9CORY|nr:YibE/F family protein [Corynebacterium pelargi]QAU51533.1 YibE/F-like protein [Corynebacterium pelargi]GGG79817.1 hypothetical protein GCM10007338_17750 [Corynebacterium pelargi]